MHTGGCHYVTIAKYNGVWWYYNDSEYLRGKKLIQYESFEDFMNEVSNCCSYSYELVRINTSVLKLIF